MSNRYFYIYIHTLLVYLRFWFMYVQKASHYRPDTGVIGVCLLPIKFSSWLSEDVKWSEVHSRSARSTHPMACSKAIGSRYCTPWERSNISQCHEIVALVHADSPSKPVMKEHLVRQIEELSGCITSSRGRITKLLNFVSAVDHSSLKLFKQLAHNVFDKLQINWA